MVGNKEFSAAWALQGAEKGQVDGEGWSGLVLELQVAVLCGGPVHSVHDHSLPLLPPHFPWSSHQMPEVSHKYSSTSMNDVPYVHCLQCHLSIPPFSQVSVSEVLWLDSGSRARLSR